MGETEEMRNQANDDMKNGNYEQAQEKYTSAINTSKKPDHTLYLNRALAHYRLGQYNFSVVDCNDAIKINPKFMKSYMTKARA